jgi:hypothetical protein
MLSDVSVELLVNDRLLDLLEGEFDVAVRIGRLRDSNLIARRIAPIRLAVCVTADYLARRGTPRAPDDLAKHNSLEYTFFESRREGRLLNPDSRKIGVPVCGRHFANNGDVLRSVRLFSGLFMFSLAASHFLCHATGLLLPDNMELVGRTSSWRHGEVRRDSRTRKREPAKPRSAPTTSPTLPFTV